MRPDVSVVIPSYGTRDATLACLRALARQTLAHEVVVVDNASPDDTADRVREAFPGVRLLVLPRNLGFAAACNRGLRETRGRAVLFLNSDTVPGPTALADLLAALDEEADVAVVGPRLTGRTGALQPSCRRDPTPAALLHQHTVVRSLRVLAGAERRYKMRDFAFDRRADVPVVMGAAMLIRRDAIEAAGGFDEGYFMYFEEADLCRRLRATGWRVAFDPRATILHAGGESSRRAGAATEAAYVRSLLRYVRRADGRGFAALFLPAWAVRRVELAARDLAAAVAAAIRGRGDAAERRVRSAARTIELVTRRLFEVAAGAVGDGGRSSCPGVRSSPRSSGVREAESNDASA